MNRRKFFLTDVPLLALVIANMVPIYGVVVFGWDAFYIVLLYWAENLIVGFYNILKIALAKVEHPMFHLGKFFLIPFFVIHYGGFAAIHGLFVFLLFGKEDAGKALELGPHPWPCFLIFVQLLVGVISHCWTTIPSDMKYVMGILFLSHGVSFVRNYLIAGEYKTSKPKDLMGQPYSRVMIMHIAILAGAFLSFTIGSPAGVLIVLIILKTIIDIKLHLCEHKKSFLPIPETV